MGMGFFFIHRCYGILHWTPLIWHSSTDILVKVFFLGYVGYGILLQKSTFFLRHLTMYIWHPYSRYLGHGLLLQTSWLWHSSSWDILDMAFFYWHLGHDIVFKTSWLWHSSSDIIFFRHGNGIYLDILALFFRHLGHGTLLQTSWAWYPSSDILVMALFFRLLIDMAFFFRRLNHSVLQTSKLLHSFNIFVTVFVPRRLFFAALQWIAIAWSPK